MIKRKQTTEQRTEKTMHTRCASQAHNSWDASSKPLSAPFSASFDTEFPCLSSVALFFPLHAKCIQAGCISEKRQEQLEREEGMTRATFVIEERRGRHEELQKGLGFQHTPSDSKAHLVSRFRHKDSLGLGTCWGCLGFYPNSL